MTSTGTTSARSATRRVVGLCAALAVALLASCTGDGQEPEPSATPTTTSVEPTESAEPTPTPTETATATVRVYSMVDTRTGLRLTRETRETATDDLITSAVELMIAGPVDPDYSSPWNPATTVLGVAEADGVIVVDLSADARTANIGSAGAALMIQQLVHTVTDAAGDESAAVLLQIDGVPAGELWGAVVWDEPVIRESPQDVRTFVQIDVPGHGATLSSPVAVSGDANAFEANVPWKVLDAAGAEVAAGATLTSEGMTFAPFSFSVDLEPGTYTIMIMEDDPSDGAGGVPMSDTKEITVG